MSTSQHASDAGTAARHRLGNPHRSWRWLALFALVVAVYSPSFTYGWLWEDDYHVYAAAELDSWSGLWDIWFTTETTPQYYPLVHSLFWLEQRLWGDHPSGYRIVNVVLHAANAVVVGLLLTRLRLPAAFLAAAIFGLHPVHVETAAWVTQGKNTLSGLFYLLAMLALLRVMLPELWPDRHRYAAESDPDSSGEPPRLTTRRDWTWYAVAFGLFSAAMFSKTVVATLPCAALLLVYFVRGRLRGGDWLLVAPLLLLGVGLGLHTAYLEQVHVGAEGPDWDFSFAERWLIAGRALWFYLGCLCWPIDLAFIYERWRIDDGVWWQYLYPAGAFAVLGLLAMRQRRWGRGPLVAALFFCGTLFPALGFVDLYPMRFSFVADHFQYLASVGPIAAAAAAGTWWFRQRNVRRGGRMAGGLLLVVLAGLSWWRLPAFSDARTLWQDTAARTDDAWIAHYNLAGMANEAGRPDEAVEHYAEVVRIRPQYTSIAVLYAEELAKLGRRQKAEHVLREVLDRKPEDPTASYGLGELLLERGAEREAVHWLGVAAEQRPREPWRWHRLGQALQASGQPQEAIGAFRVALQQSEPEQVNPWTRWRLAWCLLDVGETEASRRQARDLARRLGVADGPPRDPTLGALRQWLLKLRPRLPSETAL